MNNIENIENNSLMLNYTKTDDILCDIRQIIETAQKQAYRTVNTLLVRRNWLLGCRIAEEELKGENRAEYGAEIIKKLAKELTDIYGKGFTKTNLYSFYLFYKNFPQIFHSLSGKSEILLSWTHYRVLLQVKDKTAREWYANEAACEAWSVRKLQSNREKDNDVENRH